MTASPIREFGFKALLWLPLSFVIWFWLAPVWVLPAVEIARHVLLGFWGDLFSGVTQGGELLDVAGHVVARANYLVTLTTQVMVTVPPSADGPGGVGVLEPTLNPMVYAYSLPLFAGLAMATPVSTRRRVFQFSIALGVIWISQAFGIVAESLKVVAFDAGDNGAAAIARAGLAPGAIAVAYQFAYLVLPAVVPVALWLGLNRDFIERLTRSVGEPAGPDDGQSTG